MSGPDFIFARAELVRSKTPPKVAVGSCEADGVSARTSSAELPPQARRRASVLIIAHLAVVWIGLSGNHVRSPLKDRLSDWVRPYAQPLGLELAGVPLHLTSASESDVDHRVEVLQSGDSPDDRRWRVFPSKLAHASERQHRHQRWAQAIAAAADDEFASSQYASGIARHLASREGEAPVKIRCRRHLLLTPEQAAKRPDTDLNGPDYFITAYEATVVSHDGAWAVVKSEPGNQSALPARAARE